MTKYYLLENREIFFPTNTYTIEVTDKKFLKTIKKLKKDKISVFITNKRKPIDAYDEEFSEDDMFDTDGFNVFFGTYGQLTIDKKNDKYEFVKENGEKVEVLGNIDIKNIVFGYNKEKTVLKNISITAKQGEKIALVGATGSGKTTIANLINRFYDVNSGEILFDGINVNSIKKADLRKNVGVVLQETNLFTGTVLENLRYGHLEATREECIEACKKTGAHEFIIKLPEQYDTVLRSGGENLSQGQRQLLGISRALLENKPVLILDEATSSIDTKTENVVQKAMYVLMEGRTVFIIAHRLSTISNSDRIIVLDNGEILEMGTHDELIEKQGRYYQLYTGKFELD